MGSTLSYKTDYCNGEGGVPNCKACKDNDHKNWYDCTHIETEDEDRDDLETE